MCQPQDQPEFNSEPASPSSGHNPESGNQPEESTNQPATASRTRNGKIARLAYPERDMVNRMLRNNIPYEKICGALEEHGTRVTERNVSNWKTRGGYKEWCAEQDRALENRILQDNLIEHVRKQEATDLPEIGLQIAATNLSQFFLKPETQRQLAADPEKLAGTVSMICRLSRHIHSLQKYRDDSAKELGRRNHPQRIKNEIEQHLDSTRNVYSSFIPDTAPRDPEIPHRNFIPKNYYIPYEPLRH